LQELAAHKLVPEEWGGDTVVCRVSAKQRQGIKELLEMLVLQADLLELKADFKRRGRGVVVEARLDKGRGAVATVLVQKGCLAVGECIVIGDHFGKVRALNNDRGEKMLKAMASTPVEILGLDGVPKAGDEFYVVENEKMARNISTKRLYASRERYRGSGGHIKLQDLMERIEAGQVKELNVVLKADVSGSVEAIKKSLEEIKSDKVKARIIHGGVGDINETDVNLAAASEAIILGFHVKVASQAVELARSEKVEIRLYQVIYEAIRDVQDAMKGLLEPHYREVIIGQAEVRQIFKFARGCILGSYVTDGKVSREAKIRVKRDKEVVWEGPVSSLKRFKEDVKEVIHGTECGIAVETSSKFKEGDQVEFFVQEEVAQTI
jgi:translation initiation factor IF-2